MFKFLKRLVCKHIHTKTVTNFCGCYIIYKRKHTYMSEKVCCDCGKHFKSEEFDSECEVINYCDLNDPNTYKSPFVTSESIKELYCPDCAKKENYRYPVPGAITYRPSTTSRKCMICDKVYNISDYDNK